MNIEKWIKSLHETKNKKPFPILSFPSVQLIGTTVYDLTRNAELQARGMRAAADKADSLASVGMMDLSVEAEAFGSVIKISKDEIPTVIGALISDEDEARALKIPKPGDARTGIYIEASRLACLQIIDRPVFSGIIGPFSLAGRLMDVSEALVNCIAEPDFVHTALEKAAEFLISDAKAYKNAGSSGLIMAEPLAGLLSPELEKEFSFPYVKQIISAVKDENFAVIYHNCGPNTTLMTESISENGASAYHFGDAVDLENILKKMPADKIVFGNISPSRLFLNGTPQTMKKETLRLLERCAKYNNFVLSSGCDIPPAAPWENINAFFEAHREFYDR